jgi:hypothetical protein
VINEAHGDLLAADVDALVNTVNWAQVRPLILAAFAHVPRVDVQLFPPDGAPPVTGMATKTPRPAMTPMKAAFTDLHQASVRPLRRQLAQGTPVDGGPLHHRLR